MKTVSPSTSIIFFLFSLLFPLPCIAALITFTPGSNGAYELKADGLSAVTALDISIDYDPTILSRPRISPSILAARSNLETVADSPGSLRFTITRQGGAINGSGALVQVQFDAGGQPSGCITGLSVSLTDAGGARSSAETRIDDGGVSGGTESGHLPGCPEPSSAEPSANETSGRSGGRRGRGAHPASLSSGDRSASLNALPGVLDHVRVLGKDMDMEGLVALFSRGIPPGLRQEPAICLSDGKTRVRLMVSAASSEQNIPHFVLSGARFLSLRNSGGRNWTIEALPYEGVYQASLMVVSDAGTTVFPITVAPPVPVDGTLPVLAKKKQVKALAAALRDLRVPGEKELPDHVRRYILTANLLARKSSVHASLPR
jgi:hypothetical protein